MQVPIAGVKLEYSKTVKVRGCGQALTSFTPSPLPNEYGAGADQILKLSEGSPVKELMLTPPTQPSTYTPLLLSGYT